MSRRVPGVIAGLLALTVTACGSTVQQSAQVRAGDGSLSGGTGTTSSSAGSTGDQSGSVDSVNAPGSSTTTGGSSTTGTSATSDSGATDATGTSGSTSLPSGSSVTHGSKTSPIEIGIPYAPATTGSSIGAGLATADMHQLYEAYFKKVNARGGVLGRKLVGVYYKVDATQSFPTLVQEVCTYFTQDHRVSFVFVLPLLDLYGCLNKAGVATLSDTPQDVSKATLARWPLTLLPESMAMDRYADFEAKQFTDMGFFHHGLTDKLGVLYFQNDPASVDGFKELSKALPPLGTKIDYSEGLTFADGASGLGPMEAQVQSAELKFKAEGVTEVICVEVNAFACGFFGVYAASQSYYPRYAWSGAQVLSNVAANVPAKELVGSVFLGWYPAQDLQAESEMPARLRACFDYFRKQGIDISTGNERYDAEETCSDVEFLIAALRVAPSVSAAGLMQGAKKLGTSFPSIGTFGIRIASGQRDGVSQTRRGAFFPSCDCFRYTSGLIGV